MKSAKQLSANKSLKARLGVTRIAQVTGLDRTGIEVACAVRPTGHILQVCNGKGLSFEEAAVGALLETAELWASEQVAPLLLRYASWQDLREAGMEALTADSVGEVNELWSSRTWMAWEEGRDLHSREAVWVPAQAVRCLPPDSYTLGPQTLRWTSNGMGAHWELTKATQHALLEAIERDQLKRALPQGWTRKTVMHRLLMPSALSKAPRTQECIQQLSARGFHVYVFDLTPEGGLGIPVAGALLVDRENGPIPVTAGYACSLTQDGALLSAILEAAQSRLTDIHGAREDVESANVETMATLKKWLSSATPSRTLSHMPPDLKVSKKPLEAILEKLWKNNFRRVVSVQLMPKDMGIYVTKVLVPGFFLSELLG